jgi:hypothetical protein
MGVFSRWWLGCFLASWGALASVGIAQAPPAPTSPAQTATPAQRSDALKKKASEHFERGVTLFRDGAYRAALIEFERAYETVPDYRLLYNQAQMRMLLQDYLGATRDYERYLVDGGEKVSAERREVVERELSILRSRVARIVIKTNKDHAKVYVDDALVGETPLTTTLPLNVGRHRVYAETGDGSNATEVVDLAAGEMKELTMELKAPKVKTVVVQSAAQEKQNRVLPWVLTGGAGAFLVGAVAVGVVAGGAADDLKKETHKIPASHGDIKDARSKARTLSITTDVLGATGIALGVSAALLWTLNWRKNKSSQNDKATSTAWQLDVGFGSVGATRKF